MLQTQEDDYVTCVGTEYVRRNFLDLIPVDFLEYPRKNKTKL